jgi:hypothetical protein
MQATITMTDNHPKTPAQEIAPTIAPGTAVDAFEASSEMCTQESNPPILQTGDNQATIRRILMGNT